MKRRTLVPALVGAPAALAGTTSRTAARQEAAGIVGTWLVRETNPPMGGPAPLFFAISFHADGTAGVTGFSGSGGGGQGAWEQGNDGSVTLTVVSPLIGKDGASFEDYQLLKATVTLNGPATFTGGYETNMVNIASGSPETVFTYMGPLAGSRIAVEAPDPKALTIQPGATPAAS